MGALRLEAGFQDADGFYEALLEAHEGLTESDSAALDARLILILANQIGDRSVLESALAAARRSILSAGAGRENAAPG